jgi:hypothetical protein
VVSQFATPVDKDEGPGRETVALLRSPRPPPIPHDTWGKYVCCWGLEAVLVNVIEQSDAPCQNGQAPPPAHSLQLYTVARSASDARPNLIRCICSPVFSTVISDTRACVSVAGGVDGAAYDGGTWPGLLEQNGTGHLERSGSRRVQDESAEERVYPAANTVWCTCFHPVRIPRIAEQLTPECTRTNQTMSHLNTKVHQPPCHATG